MNSSPQKKWGIIGDGQLARMLALAAYPLGIRPVMLTSDANSSGAQVCPLQVRGSTNSRTDLHALLSQVDFAIIESEFVNCDLLEATSLANKVIPSIGSLRTLQDKLEQKKLLKRLGISTSPFYEPRLGFHGFEQLLKETSSAKVLKFATLGYDGKGVCVLEGKSTDRSRAEEFFQVATDRKIQVFAEDRVDFIYEVAMVSARSSTGEIFHYPLVLSEQREGVCYRVCGPAVHFGVDSSLELLAMKWSQKIAEETNLIGTFAVEFFVTKGGSLLVNEIAPRVHNSAHYTQNAGFVSQFENHWRAVAGLPLGKTEAKGIFAMQNFLGPTGLFSKESAPIPSVTPAGSLHWYGKAGLSPKRKLGHLNVHGSLEQKEKLLKEVTSALISWEKETLRQIPPSPMEIKL
jgi:5-(carboxyamino)imidazole ribonucleotide synthase